MNYLGLNDTVRIYFDGTELEPELMDKYPSNNTAGDGRVFLGKRYTDGTIYPVMMKIDELIFFNQALSITDIQLIYNSTQI